MADIKGRTIAATYGKLLYTSTDDGLVGNTGSTTSVVTTDDMDGTSTASCLNLGIDRVGIGTAPAQTLHVAGITRIDGHVYFQAGSRIDLGTQDNQDLQFQTDAANVMMLKAGGNVGIGTASPATALNIKYATASPTMASISVANLQDLGLLIEDSSLDNSDGECVAGIGIGYLGETTSAIIAVDEGGSGASGLGFVTGVASGVAERIRIDSTGKVGIGTASPGELLHLESTSTAEPVLRLHQFTDDATSAEIQFDNGQGGGNAGVAGHDLGRITFQGNMSNGSELKYAEIYSEIVDPNASTGKDGKIGFKVNCLDTDTEVMTIKASGSDAAGRVGIGTTSPSSTLYVKDATDSLTSTGLATFYSNSDSATGRNLVSIYNDHTSADDTICLYIDQDGGDYCILGNGGYLTTGGVWTDSSDILRKENITDLSYGLADVLKLRPVRYNYKHGGEVGVGFIAQELEQVIPEVVSGKDAVIEDVLNEQTGELKKDKIVGGKGVAYGQFTSVLVKAIQELSAKVEALENA